MLFVFFRYAFILVQQCVAANISIGSISSAPGSPEGLCCGLFAPEATERSACACQCFLATFNALALCGLLVISFFGLLRLSEFRFRSSLTESKAVASARPVVSISALLSLNSDTCLRPGALPWNELPMITPMPLANLSVAGSWCFGTRMQSFLSILSSYLCPVVFASTLLDIVKPFGSSMTCVRGRRHLLSDDSGRKLNSPNGCVPAYYEQRNGGMESTL